MPRQQQARDEGDESFREEPRYERILQRTEVERAWIYELRPDLKPKIRDYMAAKAAAQKPHQPVRTEPGQRAGDQELHGSPMPRNRQRAK